MGKTLLIASLEERKDRLKTDEGAGEFRKEGGGHTSWLFAGDGGDVCAISSVQHPGRGCEVESGSSSRLALSFPQCVCSTPTLLV